MHTTLLILGLNKDKLTTAGIEPAIFGLQAGALPLPTELHVST